MCAAGSDLASNSPLQAVIYPASLDGNDQVAYTYNRQGQPLGMTDQNGTVHAYEYDDRGRPIADAVVEVGSGVDATLLRIGTEYEVRGMVSNVTSYPTAAGSGSPANQSLSGN